MENPKPQKLKLPAIL